MHSAYGMANYAVCIGRWFSELWQALFQKDFGYRHSFFSRLFNSVAVQLLNFRECSSCVALVPYRPHVNVTLYMLYSRRHIYTCTWKDDDLDMNADAKADLSLRWAHPHFLGFVMRRLIYWCQIRHQNQKCLLVTRPNDNHSSGPVNRELSYKRSKIRGRPFDLLRGGGGGDGVLAGFICCCFYFWRKKTWFWICKKRIN